MISKNGTAFNSNFDSKNSNGENTPRSKILNAIKRGEIDYKFRFQDPNMYRTSYSDQINGRETCVKGCFPSGYGGMNPTINNDFLFRNTQIYADLMNRMNAKDRDTFGDFTPILEGIPWYTKKCRWNHRAPSNNTLPKVALQPPWAVYVPSEIPINYRTCHKVSALTSNLIYDKNEKAS